MLLGAGVLLAFLVTTNAQSPRSPVRAVISDDSTAPLPDLIKALDAAGRTEALARLDRLDRGPLDAAALAELREAYRLLGRSEDARDGGGSAGDAQNILSLARSGKYAAAQAAAERGLERFPGDKNLLALLHQVKGRGAASSSRPVPAKLHSPSSAAPVADQRPFVPSIVKGRSSPPPVPGAEAYLAPGSTKASDFVLIRNSVLNIIRYKTDVESSAEKERMAALKKKLGETETGRRLVSDLGGWERIERDVDIRFAAISSRSMGAYFRQFITPDSKGRRGAVVLRNELMHEPDGIAVPILAHELSHVGDFHGEHGLAIPSEFSAHRTQLHVFEEMKGKMSPEEIAELRGYPRGQYQNFIALLWEDRLLARFKTPEEMAAAAGSVKMFGNRSRQVLSDLKSGEVAAGGPQLDHHLNGKNSGVYSNLTAEKDIVDVVAERRASGKYEVEQQEKDKNIMAQREALLSRSGKWDAEFRVKHGFVIEEGN